MNTINNEKENKKNGMSEAQMCLILKFLLKSEIEKMMELKEKLSASKFTEKDVKEISDKINENLEKFFSSYNLFNVF